MQSRNIDAYFSHPTFEDTFDPESRPAFALNSRIPSLEKGKSRFPKNLLEILDFPFVKVLAAVVQTLDSAIHRITIYPMDSAIGFPNTHPVDSAIQRGPGKYKTDHCKNERSPGDEVDSSQQPLLSAILSRREKRNMANESINWS